MSEPNYVDVPAKELGTCANSPECDKPAVFVGKGMALCASHFAMMCIHYFATTVDHMPSAEADSKAVRIVNGIIWDWRPLA